MLQPLSHARLDRIMHLTHTQETCVDLQKKPARLTYLIAQISCTNFLSVCQGY